LEVAQDLGLNTILPDDQFEGVLGVPAQEPSNKRMFSVAMTGDEEAVDTNLNAQIFRHAVCSAVLLRPADFDPEAKPVLCVRLCGIGPQNTVSSPQRVTDRLVRLEITRNNNQDLLGQLVGDEVLSAELMRIAKDSFEATIKAKCGAHVTYDIINNAYKFLYTQQESWQVEIALLDQFSFDTMNNTVITRGRGSVTDTLVMFPLLTTVEHVVEKALEFQLPTSL
jgi:hypothetical protein